MHDLRSLDLAQLPNRQIDFTLDSLTNYTRRMDNKKGWEGYFRQFNRRAWLWHRIHRLVTLVQS